MTADAQAEALIATLCTCTTRPLGLDFILTAGCLIHDRCVCHEGEQRVSVCLWCDAFVALLKSIASLDPEALGKFKRDYLAHRGPDAR